MKRILLVLCLSLSASAAPLTSLPTNRPAEHATVYSTSHRFAVSGCPAAQGLQIAMWADDVETRIGHFVGTPLASSDPLPLLISVVEDADHPRGRVERLQSFDAGLLDQRLVMYNARVADQEDLLEGLTSLLLTRTIVARNPTMKRSGEPPALPEWLAVGIAQNLFLEGRQRNAALVKTAWKSGRSHSIRDILRWQYMPAGRWDDKYEAGVLLDFLLPQSVAAKRSLSLLAQIESGEVIDADFLAKRILFSGSLNGAEKMYDLWMAQQQGSHVRFGSQAPDRVADLVQMLEVHPGDYGVPPSAEIPLVADMRDLIRHGHDKWAQQIAAVVAEKMKTLAFGQPQEFQRVIAAYVGFLDALSKPTRGLFGDRASKSALEKLLGQAESSLIDYQVAQKLRSEAPAAAPAARSSVLEPLHVTPEQADAMRRALDAYEKQQLP